MKNFKVKFKVEIGKIFKDDNRDIIIIDREIRKDKNNCSIKYYNYKCNKCGYDEYWVREDHLINGVGCICCGKYQKILVQGINDIPTTTPWLVSYFQGGYDEAKLYTKCGGGNPNNSKGLIFPICPQCGRIRNKKIALSNIYNRHSIGCSCGDNKPYGEKFMFNVLEQLELNFETEYSPEWINPKRYDFYLSCLNIVIETHGDQHYKSQRRGRSFEQEVENDKLKKQLALHNGINKEDYIVIDCRKSEMKWIKQHILESNLANIFDLSVIDWEECNEYACSNLVKTTCDLWNKNISIDKICSIINFKQPTIIKYLNIGREFNWCNYDDLNKDIRRFGKQVEIFKDDISLGIFPSCIGLERQSEKLFGTKLFNTKISECCIGRREFYKGYTFKYVK